MFHNQVKLLLDFFNHLIERANSFLISPQIYKYQTNAASSSKDTYYGKPLPYWHIEQVQIVIFLNGTKPCKMQTFSQFVILTQAVTI